MEFRKIDEKNVDEVLKLTVNDDQKSFVATNTESIVEAYTTITSGGVAQPFALYHNELLVGFIMFGYGDYGDDKYPKISKNNYCVWRLMIDKRYQGKGYGKLALEKAIEYVKTEPFGHAEYCWLSFEPENIVGKALYNKMGFIENGETCWEEIVAVKKL